VRNPSAAKISASAFRLKSKKTKRQLKKLPHKNVVFRPVMPAVATEACVAWKGENPSAPLKAYVEIVEHVGRSIRWTRTVAGFGRAKIKAQIEKSGRRRERDFDQTAFTLFQKATGIKQSKTRRSAQRHSRSGRGR
jgi:hypothetical protein